MDLRRRGLWEQPAGSGATAEADAVKSAKRPAKKVGTEPAVVRKKPTAKKPQEDLDWENRRARADRSGRWRRGGSPPPTGGISRHY